MKVLWAICFCFAFMCMGCPMEIEIECGGAKVGMLVEIDFKAEEQQSVNTTNLFGQVADIAMSGAHLEIGIKQTAGQNLKNCCLNGKLVWRQWTRSNKGTTNVNTGRYQDANTWYPDIFQGNRNLPTTGPSAAQQKKGFTERYVDRPSSPLSAAKDGDLTWEAVTAYGCEVNGRFTPLAAFKWGWEMDSKGNVSLSSLQKVELSALEGMKLP